MPDVVKTSDHHIKVEQKIINLMLDFLNVVDELLNDGISKEFFNDYHKPLVEAVYDEALTSGYKRRLTREAFRQSLIDQGRQSDVMQLLEVYDKCKIRTEADVNDLGYLKKQLVDSYVGKNSVQVIDKWRQEAKDKGYLYASANLIDRLNSAIALTETRQTAFVTLDELKGEFITELKERASNPHATIRCNIPEIDRSIRVGFRPQHLTLFVADVGGHKTNLMLNVGLNIYDEGHSVLFIPLEMSRLDLGVRILCNRGEISSMKLANPEVMSPDDWAKIEEADIWKRKDARFCILDGNERTSVSSLKREIEKRVKHFEPKVVIIDYIDNLESDVRYGSKTVEIGEVLKSLRFLGKQYGFHIISAAQMNRQAIKALREGKDEAVDSTAIHGSHSYSADSDTIFALQRIKDEPDKIKIHTIKARHGQAGGTGTLTVDADRYHVYSTDGEKSMLSDSDVEEGLNLSPSDILQDMEDNKEEEVNVDFAGADLDGLDDL